MQQVKEQTLISAKLQEEPRVKQYYAMIAVVLVGLFLWSMSVIEVQPMSKEGSVIAKNIFKGILNPDWAFLFDFTQKGVPFLLLETISIAVLGTLVGAMIAVPLAFLSATNIVPKPVATVVRFIIMAIRTIPPFVYGLMFIRVTGPGASAGVLTLAVVSIGMISKMFTETIEDLDKGILESLEAAGCSLFQKIRFGIIPQLKADFFSLLLYRFDMNLRDATILGLVGAGGIGAPLIFAMNAYKWTLVGAILIGLFFLIFIVEAISSRIRTYLLKG
ncbi:phosphonate ABC transporter, permease protein PhnE [Enterococcus faecalis]|uniref:phosphonate ABC transporter, permease protein PhnE n=1 Tax=Enterococcus faecalis TaxID=1351 RepID=UPI002DBFDD99|nr:phosphonate ABC transporter, permease protein PhnE [Enterococcus faecalis]MEB7792080.1 phosphonate ABC transporter, permease protein PhnE [Enterococcus faecalis]MEB7810068.1 phosphonate ABC transporter, permease protein PhnE [Enterococcus faecalis]